MTAEQQARDMLERIGVDGAQSFSSGDVVELANLISLSEENKDLRQEIIRLHTIEFLQELNNQSKDKRPIIRLHRDARATVAELIDCCSLWEPGVCILGNVRAGDAVSALQNLLESAEEQSHRVMMAQNKKLYADAMEFGRRALFLSNENGNLRAFAVEVMTAWPDGGIEGDDLQEIAVKHGMLAPETRFEPCGDGCKCTDYLDSADWQRGVTCYRRTALLNGEE